MAAFLGISIWITLATVVPGLVTLAVLAGAAELVLGMAPAAIVRSSFFSSEWVDGGVAITTMVLTQALGILLEKQLVDRHLLGPTRLSVHIPEGIDPGGCEAFILEPYAEYQGIYLLLAELQEHEDVQGHLQRALAQFFLTNNTLIAFVLGILVSLALMFRLGFSAPGLVYVMTLVFCLLVSFHVARIRFVVMAKALWAARRRRCTQGKAGDFSPGHRFAAGDEARVR